MIGPATTPVEQWWRKAEVLSVHDGDTLLVSIDLGFDTHTVHPLRVFGVNAPELKTADGSGRTAQQYTFGWSIEHRAHGGFLVHFMSWDKYAPRFDGILVCALGHCLNDALLETGHAVVMKS